MRAAWNGRATAVTAMPKLRTEKERDTNVGNGDPTLRRSGKHDVGISIVASVLCS